MTEPAASSMSCRARTSFGFANSWSSENLYRNTKLSCASSARQNLKLPMEGMAVDPQHNVRVWQQRVWEFEIAHVGESGACHAVRRAGWIARGARVHLPDLDFFRVRHIRSHLLAACPSQGASRPCTPTTTTPASQPPAQLTKKFAHKSPLYS
jgi:hypothetical protein